MEPLINIDTAVNLLEMNVIGIKTLDDDIFTYTLKDGNRIVFYIDREKRSVSAHFPYIFQARDGSYYRYIRERDYNRELTTVDGWKAFVWDAVLTCHHGVYDHLIVH